MDATPSFWEAWQLWRDPMAVAILAAALLGFIGVYIVLKRVVFVSAALSQISGVGVATAFYLASILDIDAHNAPIWLHPIWYSTAFAVAGATLFSLGLGHRRISGETVIGLAYLVASASVLLIMGSPHVTQEAHEVNDLLYGNAVAVPPAQLTIMGVTTLLVLGIHAAFAKELLFVSFDPEMARTLGVGARRWNLLLFVTFAVAISAGTRAIGALPVFAFMVIPPAAALLLGERLRTVFIISVVVAVLGAALGYYFSYIWSLPTGASMVVVTALFLIPGLIKLRFRGGS